MLETSLGFLQRPAFMSDLPKLRFPLIDRLRLVLSILRSEKQLIFTLPLGLVAAILIVVARPFVLVRVGFLHSDRIGHFTINHELFLCEEAGLENKRGKKPFDIYYFGRIPVCNEQLARMWSRRLRIWPRIMLRPISLIMRSVGALEQHVCGEPVSGTCDIYNLLDSSLAQLSFTDLEEEYGKKLLQEMGIPANRDFICLISRDRKYLDGLYGKAADYHNYRNVNISNFLFAAEELAKLGYYVLRMGSVVEEPLRSDNPMVIDYATNGMRSDFMDVFLGAKCLFCISTSTGFDGIPTIFRKPLVIVNHAPAAWLPTFWSKSIVLLKHHRYLDGGEELGLTEILQSNAARAMSTMEFLENGIVLIENSPQEISDACLEMVKKIEGNWILDTDELELQNRFRAIFHGHARSFVSSSSGRPMHGEIFCSYSTKFLKNQTFFLGNS